MEISGIGSFLRNRRFGNYLEASFGVNFASPSKVAVKEEVEKKIQSVAFVEDDGIGAVLISWVRIVVCFVTMMFTTFIWALIMLVLFPWPYQRIRQGNIYGHLTGRLLMWILGNPIKIEGSECADEKVIYICNHASPIDIFLIMWLTPTGTVGVAKKEIIWYPLFGQLYFLANHLRIDRSNPSAAIQSMKEAAHTILKNNLSLIIFPEGTRSKSGRLLPFKKGFVHVALQTRRPIVPVVFTGTHRAWRKGSLHVRPAPLNVKYLPPIRTDDWTADKIEDYVKMVHDVYVKNLPESQRPMH
ncbi:1-acyl-sn-glycerol-3-phosphate acyltransferase-like isoform X1 [Coffea eugenioides]|uniref:1-acyl-sn-glycerol-3-phosphate acyltransferase-like isoform X1 n=1 Tax=Coffea eugenioides TaxID=49369 RepID=UPI000F61110C|nr:1-acyl-sn-glycerol-3-phosphate acyltransferase-like isoform X1 [Coffea eugenioides]XP_027172389.1 1-acyl-sn-glycerol-3-phosphate acyltransferase-like isoform X1 [Coffea eugenioides]